MMMKAIQSAFVAVTLIFLSTAAMAGAGEYKLHISGLACPFCAYGLEQRFSAIEGVEKVTVDLKTGVAIVSMTDGATLDEAFARKTVEDAGFTLESIEFVTAQESSGRPRGES